MKKFIFVIIIVFHLRNILTLPLVADQDVEQLEDLNQKSKIEKLETELQKLRQQLQILTSENRNGVPANQNDAKIIVPVGESNIITDNQEKIEQDNQDDGVFGTFYDYPVIPSVRRVEKIQEGWLPMKRADQNIPVDQSNDVKQKMIDAVEQHIIKDLHVAIESGVQLQAILKDIQLKRKNLIGKP